MPGTKAATSARVRGLSLSAPVSTALTVQQKNGTAFQPSTSSHAMVNITATLSGLLNGASVVTVATSPTQNGTYTTVSIFSLFLSAAGVAVSDAATGSFPVPAGHWVKVTQTGVSILGNIAMNRVVWLIG